MMQRAMRPQGSGRRAWGYRPDFSSPPPERRTGCRFVEGLGDGGVGDFDLSIDGCFPDRLDQPVVIDFPVIVQDMRARCVRGDQTRVVRRGVPADVERMPFDRPQRPARAPSPPGRRGPPNPRAVPSDRGAIEPRWPRRQPPEGGALHREGTCPRCSCRAGFAGRVPESSATSGGRGTPAVLKIRVRTSIGGERRVHGLG